MKKANGTHGANAANIADAAHGANAANIADAVCGANAANTADAVRGANAANTADVVRGVHGTNSAHTVALGGLLTALALIFSYVEMLIPFSIGIPGIKLGFANIVIVFALYRLGARYAVLVNICRILLSGLLFGSVFSTLYALSGGLISIAGMILLRKTGVFSTTGVSMAGGVLHNLGQLLVAVFVVKTGQVFLYFPVLVFSGIAAGIVNGIIATLCLKKIKQIR